MTSRSFFVLSLIAFVAAVVVAVVALPDRVPMHFDIAGEVDRWASRGELLVAMGLVGVLMAALFGGVAAGVDRIPFSMINVPHKAWWSATPERQAVVRSRMRTDMHVIGGLTLLLLTVILLLTVRAARLVEPRLDAWFWVALAVYLTVIAAFTAYAVVVRYRKESE